MLIYFYVSPKAKRKQIMISGPFIDILVFILGACIGSFLNVCIYRLPLSKSIVSPGSSCPSCGQPIRFYNNVPILSYLVLLGRCRSCGAKIGLRYPLVEALTGLVALAVWHKFGPTPAALIYFVFIGALIVITFIDLSHCIIPDVITLPGIVVFFCATFFLPAISYKNALAGLLLGGGLLWAIAWGYHLITGKEGMGGGDIKLLAMIGALTGVVGVCFTVFVSSAVGTLAGLITMLFTRQGLKLAIPFGPFLAIGAAGYIFYGPQLISWYINLLR